MVERLHDVFGSDDDSFTVETGYPKRGILDYLTELTNK